MVSLSQLKQFVDATIVTNAANTSVDPHQHQHDEIIDILSTEGPVAASTQFNENIKMLTKASSTDAAIRIQGASVRLMAIWFDTLRAKLQQALLRPTDLFNEFSSNPNEDNLAVFMDAFLEFNQEMDQLLSVGGDEDNTNNNTSRIGPVGNPFEINDRLLDLYKMAIGSAIGAVQVETVKNFKAVSGAVATTADKSYHHDHDDDVGHHQNTADDNHKHQPQDTAKKTAFGGINFSQVGERSPPHAYESEFHSLPRDRDVHGDDDRPNVNHHRQLDHEDLVQRSFPSKNEDEEDVAASEYNLRYGAAQKQDSHPRRHVDPIRVDLQRSNAVGPRNPHAGTAVPTSTQSRRQPDAMSTASVAASDDPGVAEHIQHTKKKKFDIAEKVGGGPTPLSVAEERLQASRSSRIEAQRNAAKGGTPARSASAGVGVGGRAPSSSAGRGGIKMMQYSVADAMRHDVDHDLPIRGRAGKQYKSSDPNSIANVRNEEYYNNQNNYNTQQHHHAELNVSASSIDTTGSGVSSSHAERMQEEKRRKIAEYERSVDKQRNDYFQHLQKERVIPAPSAVKEDAPSSQSTTQLQHHQRNILTSMFDSGGGESKSQSAPQNLLAHSRHQQRRDADASDDDDDSSKHQHRGVGSKNTRRERVDINTSDVVVASSPYHYQEPLHRQLPSPRVNPDADRPNSRRPQPNNRDSPMMSPPQQQQHHQQYPASTTTHQVISKPQQLQQQSLSPKTTSETSKMTQLRIEMATLKKQLSASQSGAAGGSQEIQYYAIHKRMQRVRAEMIQEQRDIDAVAHMEEDRKSLQRDLQAKRKQFKR